jgi:hypothetical protein
MATEPDHGQLKSEADRCAEEEERLGPRPGRIPARRETVEPQPRELYRPAHFLAKAATPALAAELGALLEELWALNQRWAGERVLEVAAYFAATGEHLDLERRFVAWSDAYGRRRADPARVSPMVDNNPYLLARKAVGEWESVLGRLADRERTLNILFLAVPREYVNWLAYDRLWKHLVRPVRAGHVDILYQRSHPATPKAMYRQVSGSGWLDNHLRPLLERVRAWAPAARLDREAVFSEKVMRARIQGLADDIQQMRPFLVRNFRPEKTIVTLTPDCAAAWKYRIGLGMAGLVVGRTAVDVRRKLAAVRSLMGIRVGHDGLFLDRRMPWYTTADLAASGVDGALALNYLLLEHFRDRLYSFYDRIDFSRLRRRPAAEEQPAAESRADDEQAVAAACRVLAEQSGGAAEEGAEEPSFARIPVLRLPRLLRLFERRFGCEVGPGKGSEVNVFRPGGKVYTVACHKRNTEIYPRAVRRMLRTLNIPVGEFLDAVFE